MPGILIATLLATVSAKAPMELTIAIPPAAALYRAIFESIDDGVCVFQVLSGADGKACNYRVLAANPAFEKQTGLVDAVGKTARDLAAPLEARAADAYGRAVSTGEAVRFETRPDGAGRRFDVSATRVGDPRTGCVVAVFRVLSNRPPPEAAAPSTEALYRSVVEFALDGIYLADQAGQFIDVNPAGAAMLGYTREELARMSIADIIRPEDAARLQRLRQTLAEGEHVKEEWDVRRKDGQYVPLELSLRFTPDGRWQGIGRDVSERRRAEARNQFLLQLQDDVREFTDPSAIMASAASLLGRHLGVAHCAALPKFGLEKTDVMRLSMLVSCRRFRISAPTSIRCSPHGFKRPMRSTRPSFRRICRPTAR